MRAVGTLNATTYRQLRDAIVKAAAEEPPAVIIEVDKLDVRDSSGWSVFTSCRWDTKNYSEVPILLVSGDVATRQLLERVSVSRYVPVYPTIRAASEAVRAGSVSYVRRTRVELPNDTSSIALANGFVTAELIAWSRPQCIAPVSIVASLLVDNALRHGCGDYAMRLEGLNTMVKVVVEDGNSEAATRFPSGSGHGRSGLDVVADLSVTWGNNFQPNGKAVWALISADQTLDRLGQADPRPDVVRMPGTA